MQSTTRSVPPLSKSNGDAHRSSWIELSNDAFASNVQQFRQVLGEGTLLGGVVKGNAYGHGLEGTLRGLHHLVDVLYVITAQEAASIREWEQASHQTRRRVIVLGAISAEEALALAFLNVEVAITDDTFTGWGSAIREAGAPALHVHVHIDTGLGREGYPSQDVVERFGDLGQWHRELRVRGAMTHFANTEDVLEQGYATRQLAAFDDGIAALAQGLDLDDAVLEAHVAATAASIVLPRSRKTIARVGIGLYGLWPSRETRLSARLVLGRALELEPVLSWRCESQLVKTLSAGSYVGYGCTYRCRDETEVAIFPVGYFDGYPRALSNTGHVLVNGRRCPVLGRVMMNHVIVDVTGAANSGDRVTATLLGSDGRESVSAEDMAEWAGTINYEIVTRLGGHLARRER